MNQCLRITAGQIPCAERKVCRWREKCCAPTEFMIDWCHNRTESPDRMDPDSNAHRKRIEPDQNRSPLAGSWPATRRLCSVRPRSTETNEHRLPLVHPVGRSGRTALSRRRRSRGPSTRATPGWPESLLRWCCCLVGLALAGPAIGSAEPHAGRDGLRWRGGAAGIQR